MNRPSLALRLLPLVLALPLLGFDCGSGRECVYDGKTYADGASFPSTDGCNTCSCANGNVACTEKACAGQWWRTCGDPVCRGYTQDPNVPKCTTQKVGDACSMLNERCDPVDQCNVKLICATSDPTKQPGGCPISRAKYKRDIAYLDDAALDAQRRAVLDLKLATYKYKATGPDGPSQLGFIIDDVGAGPAINPDGESVNLYGYASMAVAAIQAQEREIAALREEVAQLRRALAEKPQKRAR